MSWSRTNTFLMESKRLSYKTSTAIIYIYIKPEIQKYFAFFCEWWVGIEPTNSGFAIHPLNHSGTTTFIGLQRARTYSCNALLESPCYRLLRYNPNCGADRTRTCDFLRAREAFSQLNYSPIYNIYMISFLFYKNTYL